MSTNLTYLGILAAPTADGKQAVGVALTGAVELYHLADAGLDTSSDVVSEWLWTAGINPDEAATALPPRVLIQDILIPAIGDKVLVVHHGDVDIPLVDRLLSSLISTQKPVIFSGVSLDGELPQASGGAAGRRALALQSRYESAIEEARLHPAIHHIDGKITDGMLSHLSIDGPFAKRSWTLESEEDAFLVLVSILHLGDLASYVIAPGPAQVKIKQIANQVGLDEKLAA